MAPEDRGNSPTSVVVADNSDDNDGGAGSSTVMQGSVSSLFQSSMIDLDKSGNALNMNGISGNNNSSRHSRRSSTGASTSRTSSHHRRSSSHQPPASHQHQHHHHSTPEEKAIEEKVIDAIGKTCVKFFGPVCLPRPVDDRLTKLSVEHLDNYVRIKSEYEASIVASQSSGEENNEQKEKKSSSQHLLPEDLVLRASMARGFDVDTTLEMLRRMDAKVWNTVTSGGARKLERDLRLGMVVPLPFLRTAVANDVIYFCPSKLSKERSATAAIQIMLYVLNAVYERYRSSKRRICLLLNLKNWAFEINFRLDSWMAWMDVWQGRVGPVRASQILVVHATEEFKGRAWTMVKTMCQGNYAQRVHFLESEEDLGEHLTNENFQECLPDEFETGSVPTGRLLRDFMRYRTALEKHTHKSPSSSPSSSSSSASSPDVVPQTPSTSSRKSAVDVDSSRQKRSSAMPQAPPQSPRRRQTTHRPAVSARRGLMSRNSSVPCLTRPRGGGTDNAEDDPAQEIDSDSENDTDDGPAYVPQRTMEADAQDLSVRVRRPSMDEEYLQFDVAALMSSSKDAASQDREEHGDDDAGGASSDDGNAASTADSPPREKKRREPKQTHHIVPEEQVQSTDDEGGSKGFRSSRKQRLSRRSSTNTLASPEQSMPVVTKQNRRNRMLRASSVMALTRAVSIRAPQGGNAFEEAAAAQEKKQETKLEDGDGLNAKPTHGTDLGGVGGKKKGRGLLQSMKKKFQSRRNVLRSKSADDSGDGDTAALADSFEYDDEQADRVIASSNRKGKGFQMMG